MTDYSFNGKNSIDKLKKIYRYIRQRIIFRMRKESAMTEEEFMCIENIYYDIKPCVNIIQTWNEVEFSGEIKLALNGLLPAIKKFKTFLNAQIGGLAEANQNIVEKDEM